MDGLSQASG